MLKTLRYVLPITLIAMGLAWVSEQVASFLGYDLPPQDLVRLFRNPAVAWQVKAKWAAIAVVVCPPVEELVFRLGLFNGLDWLFRRACLPPALAARAFPAAALLSGAVFAACHFHIATFVPLWFLGVAFAWVYRKGGTILASIQCHFLFNLINLTLCLAFPE